MQEHSRYGYMKRWTWRDAPFEVTAEEAAQELHKRQPVLNLLRTWCGDATEWFDEAAAMREANTRMRELLKEAALALKYEGRTKLASRLLKEIGAD